MNEHQPEIGVVIIGINVASYIADCIRSVHLADYPQERISVIYVDGGSMDDSIGIAKSFDQVTVVELDDPHPTPGRGRNAGWKALSTPYIQFMDADTIVHPDWFKRSIDRIEGQCVAVCGHRRERYPQKNIFHVLTEMEWHYEMGPCRYFGGEVLLKRTVLEETGGFDENLVAGEDPELSYRIRQNGWEIQRLDLPMTRHDINMRHLRQYIKRAYRSGYAYAEIGLRFMRNTEKMWLKELIRVTAKAMLPILLISGGVMVGWAGTGLFLGLIVLFRPMFSLPRLKRTYGQTWTHTLTYAVHSACVVFPQFFGVLRYLSGKALGRPLKNKGRAAVTETRTPA